MAEEAAWTVIQLQRGVGGGQDEDDEGDADGDEVDVDIDSGFDHGSHDYDRESRHDNERSNEGNDNYDERHEGNEDYASAQKDGSSRRVSRRFLLEDKEGETGGMQRIGRQQQRLSVRTDGWAFSSSCSPIK